MTGRYVIDSRLFLAVVLTVLGLAVTGLAFKVWILDEQRADQLTEQQVASCQRGNLVRGYLAFDNDEAITVLHAKLADPDVDGPDRAASLKSLQRRQEVAAALGPFNCESLR